MPETPADNKTLNSSNFFGMGVKSGLERRVENNEKKITSLKNILKIRKVASKKLLLASSEEGGERNQTIITNNFGDRLKNISEALGVLFRIKKQEVGFDKKVASQDLKDDADKDKAEREKELESKKKEEKGSKKSVNLKLPSIPAFGGLFDTVKRFFGNILAGSIVLKMLNWVNDPANQESINKFTDFLKENALAIAGIVAFIAALPLISTLLSFTSLLISGIALLAPALGWLFSPLGLIALAVAVGIPAAVKGSKAINRAWVGGEAFAKLHAENDKMLNDAGMLSPHEAGHIGAAGLSGPMIDTGELDVTQSFTTGFGAIGGYEAPTKRVPALTGVNAQGEFYASEDQRAIALKWIKRKNELYELNEQMKRDITSAEKSAGIERGWFGRIKPTEEHPHDIAPLKKQAAEIKSQIESKYARKLQSKSSSPQIKPEPANDLGMGAIQNQIKDLQKQEVQLKKSVSSTQIDQPLTGEGTVKFIDLGEGGGDQQQSSSGTESGNSGTWFSSRSGRTGNAVTLGVINNA